MLHSLRGILLGKLDLAEESNHACPISPTGCVVELLQKASVEKTFIYRHACEVMLLPIGLHMRPYYLPRINPANPSSSTASAHIPR